MRVYDKKALHYISLFELVTGESPIDCVPIEDKIYFVVMPDKMKLILLNGGKSIKMIEKQISKQIVIFPFYPTKEEFIKKVLSNRVKIVESDGLLKLYPGLSNSKKIKRDGEAIKKFLSRIYNVDKTVFRW